MPTVYAMAGIPGSGKSTFVDQAIAEGRFPDVFILDPDRTMRGLDGYIADLKVLGDVEAYSLWEMKARKISYGSFERALSAKDDMIIDMGHVREENFVRLKYMKSIGYRIVMYYIFCDVDEALRRIVKRERYTPPEMVHERSDAIKRFIPRYRDFADEFYTYDNSDLSRPFSRLKDAA